MKVRLSQDVYGLIELVDPGLSLGVGKGTKLGEVGQKYVQGVYGVIFGFLTVGFCLNAGIFYVDFKCIGYLEN